MRSLILWAPFFAAELGAHLLLLLGRRLLRALTPSALQRQPQAPTPFFLILFSCRQDTGPPPPLRFAPDQF